MRKALLVGAAIAVATPSFANAASPAPAAVGTPVRWSGNGHLYVAISRRSGLSWVEATLRARQRGCGWYLATITSPEENQFVFGLIAGKPQFFVEGNYGPWIGGFQTDSKVEPGGHWRWITGEPFSYTDWAAGKPDNGSGGDPLLEPGIPPGQGEGFLHYYGPSGGWNDLNVNAQPHGYILEFDQEHKKSCTP